MPPDLIAAFSPSAGGVASPVPLSGAGPGATGPPESSSLAALFASLLAGTQSPPAAPISAAPISVRPAAALPGAAQPIAAKSFSFGPVSALPRPIVALPGADLPVAQLTASLLTNVSDPADRTETADAPGSGKKAGEAGGKDADKADAGRDAGPTNIVSPPLPPLSVPVLAPPPPPVLAPPPVLPADARTTRDIQTDIKTDIKTDIIQEKPMDTAPALAPHGESFLPQISLAPSSTGMAGSGLFSKAFDLQSAVTGNVPGAMPQGIGPNTPAANTSAGNMAATVPAASATIPVAGLQTPAADTRVATLPNIELAVAGVGDSSKPSLLPSSKTPQKDLKIAGSRADTITSTQTELPRLTEMNRNTLPTDGHSTDGILTDEPPTDGPHTEERRTEAGQGQAALPAATPLLHTGAAATAAPQTQTLTHTEKLAIVQQLADGAGTLRLPVKSGASETMTVQLHPKDWGSLHVTVQIAPAVSTPGPGGAAKEIAPKTVTAQIVAETPQVKAALESHSGELRDKLREAGLHLDTVTVTVRTPDAKQASGMTLHGGQADTQGRFQDGTQGSMTQGSSQQGGTQSQGGTQGSDFGQRIADVSGRQDGTPGGSAGPALSGGGASGSQGGRQGGQTPHETLRWIGTEPEPETAPRWAANRSPGAVRLDLRA